MIDLLLDGLRALPDLVRAVARGFPHYRSAREMIAAAKAESEAREPGAVYGVTVNAPAPDGKDHER